jgi:hypothetical protein
MLECRIISFWTLVRMLKRNGQNSKKKGRPKTGDPLMFPNVPKLEAVNEGQVVE